MKARTTIILALIAAVLVIIAVTSNRSEKERESIEPGLIFPDLQREAITEIRMTAGEDTVCLVKEQTGWVVATEGNYRADSMAVARILEKIDAFDRRHIHSRNPENQKTFEVDDSSGTEVLVVGPEDNTLAHFRVGKNGPDFRSQYVRPVDSNEVFLIPEYLKSVFDAKRATWRDKSIFSFKVEKVKRLLIQPEDKDTITIEKNDQDTYVMTAPDSAGVKKQMVESTIRTLAMLRCDAFPDSLPTLAEAGLEPPRQRIEVQLDDGASYALVIGNETDAARQYVKKDGDDTIYLLSKGRAKSLMRDAAELKEEPPASPKPAAEEELD